MKPLQVYLSIAYGGTRGGGHLARVRNYLEALAFRIPIALTLIIDDDSIALLQASHSTWQQTSLIIRYISIQELMDAKSNCSDIWFDILVIDRCQPSSALTSFASCGRKVLVISDTIDNPYLALADLVVDFNYGAEHSKLLYQQLVPSRCKLLLGWEYAPIQPDRVAAKEALPARRRQLSPPWELLITMGSEDPLGFTEMALNALIDSSLAQDVANIKVIQGPLFNRDLSASYPLPLNIIRAPEALQQHYAEADLCISTGGVSTWERLRAKLPTRLVPYSKLQQKILLPLHEIGLIEIFPGFTSLCAQSMNPLSLIRQIESMCQIGLGSRAEEVITGMITP